MTEKKDIPSVVGEYKRRLEEYKAQAESAEEGDIGELTARISENRFAFYAQLDGMDSTWDERTNTNPDCILARDLDVQTKGLEGQLKHRGLPQAEVKSKPGNRICTIHMPRFNTGKDVTRAFRRLAGVLGDQEMYAEKRTKLTTIAELIGLLVFLDEETAPRLLEDDTIGPVEKEDFQKVLDQLRPLALNAFDNNDVGHKDTWFNLARNAMDAEMP